MLKRLFSRSAPAQLSVLMVCSGNICRSPTAQSVLMQRLKELNTGGAIHVDSAGIEGYHVGEPPDPRTQSHAAKRGYDLSKQRARRFMEEDFARFDLILAMDGGHLRYLRKDCPPEHAHKLALLLGEAEVPDPFYGGPAGFERVLDLIEARCATLASELVTRLSKPADN
ncbi:MAG TPA: low molecular weight protein-tyrosine-phosphatase [Burkholderiaceae bacterium]